MDDSLFSDLASLGLGDIADTDIFEEKDNSKTDATQNQVKEVEKEEINEEEFIFDKTMTCPVCDKSFKTKQVKTGKARFLGTDSDLRPRYNGVDTVKYDVAVCLHCGYAGLVKSFTNITVRQGRDIKEKVSKTFKGMTNDIGPYSYETAIQRYKLALYSAVVKQSKISERAYICLKLAWLYRGARENYDTSAPKYSEITKEFAINELSFIKKAYEGFTTAIAKEMPPICGMDENTVSYMMADLARQCQDFDNAEKFAFQIISSRTVSAKVKEKARDEIEVIRKARERVEGK